MISLTTAESALKDAYLNAVCNQLNTNANPVLSKIKQSSADVYGKNIIINTQKMIPTLLEMKLLLVEAGLKLSNADTDTIKTIEKKVLSEVDSKVSFITKITPEDVTYPSFECDDIVAVGTKKVKYTTGKKTIVGIKTNKL